MLRDHLDPFPAAKACLALTCHCLLGIMGIKSLYGLNIRHSEDREEFLNQLYVPGYFYYYKYSVLRPLSNNNIAPWKYKELEEWDDWYEKRWFLEDDKKYFWDRAGRPHPHQMESSAHIGHLEQLWSHWTYRYRFEYLHLQLVMQRHRLGPDYGISLSNLSLIEVIERPRYFDGCVALVSSEARVCRHDDKDESEDFLYLRIQNCIYLPEGASDTHTYLFNALGDICKHQSFPKPFNYTDGRTNYDNLTSEICPVRVGLNKYCHYNYVSLSDSVPEGIWPSESQCFECPKCELNFQICINRRAHQPWKLLVFVTRWYNVGQGKSPREAEWSRHIPRDFEHSYCYNLGSGAVRQKFEEAPGLSQSELLNRNTYILESGDYKNWKGKFVDQIPPVYYFPGNYVPQTHPEASDQSQSENLPT
jgi:hypothetical protein